MKYDISGAADAELSDMESSGTGGDHRQDQEVQEEDDEVVL